jgi:hypothetical protein
MCVFTVGRNAVPLIPNFARMISISEGVSYAVLFHYSFAPLWVKEVGKTNFYNVV